MSRTKTIGWIIAALATVGAAGAAVYWFAFAEQHSDERLVLYGNVEIRQTHLALESPGRIEAVYVQEGDRVTAGRLLAEVDARRYKARLARAEAQLAAQEDVLNRLLAGSRPEEIAAARALVRSAEAALQEARKTFRRSRRLAASQYVSQQRLDNHRAARDAAEAALDAENQMLALAIQGPRQEDIDQARSGLAARRAAVSLAKAELADTRLTAPTDGIVRDRILEPGDMASPGKPVVTMALTSPLWVRAYLSEPDLGKIAPGMPAEVRTDSYPDKHYTGWVGYIAPTAEFTPKQVQTAELRSKLVYQVRIFVCDSRNELRLGMPATVTIDPGAPAQPGRPPAADPCREDEHGDPSR